MNLGKWRLGTAIFFMALPSPAFSWGGHAFLLKWSEKALSPAPRGILDHLLDLPRTGLGPFEKRYQELSTELDLNPGVASAYSLSPSGPSNFPAGFLDEPDFGMDQNLPDSSDPHGYRPWMGGKTGLPSQGFRHMYFGGWTPAHPLTTLQVPLHAVGEAPERTELLARKAKSLLPSALGEDRFWAIRILLWSAHYVQDLAQPFHSVQLPSLRFVAFDELLQWPPGDAFKAFVRETTRIVSNEHFAYEELTARGVRAGRFNACLQQAESRSNLHLEPGPAGHTPRAIALAVSRASISLAPAMSKALNDLFGDSLSVPGVDLSKKVGGPDYDRVLSSEEGSRPLSELDAVTCTALSNAVQGTSALIEWALEP